MQNYQAQAYLRRQAKYYLKVLSNVGGVKYHSTQINLADCDCDVESFTQCTDLVSSEDIYEEHPYHTDAEDGLERNPHITVLYGLEEEKDYFDIRRICEGMGDVEFEVGKISAFRNPEMPYDVLILEIISPELHELHHSLRQFPNQCTFPDYKPHMTLGYIKKDSCYNLEGEDSPLTGKLVKASLAHYCHLGGYYLPLPLNNY